MRKALVLSLFFLSCSNLEMSEREKIQRKQAKGEFIERKASDRMYSYSPPKLRKRPPYPWEKKKT